MKEQPFERRKLSSFFTVQKYSKDKWNDSQETIAVLL